MSVFDGSWRKQRSSRYIYIYLLYIFFTSASLTRLKALIVWITTVKFLEMREVHHLICFLRNLHAGQETTVELDVEQWTGFKLGRESRLFIVTLLT